MRGADVGTSRLMSVLRILTAAIAYRQWVRSLLAISETVFVSTYPVSMSYQVTQNESQTVS
jgi:hypothetical protein